jgi:hypothetical protein
MLLKKSPASRSIARNGEFQNPKGRVLESKFPIGAYFDENLLRARGQNRFSTASTQIGSRSTYFAVMHNERIGRRHFALSTSVIGQQHKNGKLFARRGFRQSLLCGDKNGDPSPTKCHCLPKLS